MAIDLNQKDAIDLTTTQTVGGDKKFTGKVAIGTATTPLAACQITGGLAVTNLATAVAAPAAGAATISGALTVTGTGTFSSTLAVGGILTGNAASIFAGFRQALRTVTANATVTATDYTILADATAGPITITLLTVGTAGNGRVYRFKKIDASANAVTIARAGTDTIYTNTAGNTNVALTAQGQSITLQCSNAGTWFVL
jgi:hypothetical protein